MNIQSHKIQDSQSHPRSPAVPVSAHRANSACDGRANSTLPPSAPLKRPEIPQTLLDKLAMGFALLADFLFLGIVLLVIPATAVAIMVGLFILFFVGT